MEKLNDNYKILSIDGGGIRGLCTAAALEVLENRFGCRTADCFDMLCGTSTGAIIAAALSIGIRAADIADFFRAEGPKVFPHINWPSRCLAFLKQALFKSKYDNKVLRASLLKVFGDKKLSDAKVSLCIPVFNMSQGVPYVFKSEQLTGSAKAQSPLLLDVLLAASAAPGYFPIYSIKHDLYIDGGIWANNPSLIGLFEAMKPYSISNPNTSFSILSMGSIENAVGSNHGHRTLSLWQWYKTEWLLESYFQAQSKMVNNYAAALSELLPINFVRLAVPRFTETNFRIEIDNASPATLKELEHLGITTGELEADNPKVKQFFEK